MIAVDGVVNFCERSGSRTPGYNGLRDFPGRYNLCAHIVRALFGSYFGELYRSVQQVYENGVGIRLLSTV